MLRVSLVCLCFVCCFSTVCVPACALGVCVLLGSCTSLCLFAMFVAKYTNRHARHVARTLAHSAHKKPRFVQDAEDTAFAFTATTQCRGTHTRLSHRQPKNNRVQECEDFDLCSKCYKAHPHPHEMEKVGLSMLEDLDVEEPPARSTGPTPSGEKEEKGGEVKQEAAGTCVCMCVCVCVCVGLCVCVCVCVKG